MNEAPLFLRSALLRFQTQKQLAERALVQLSGVDLHRALHAETNCCAVVMQHMAGNMRSRWTDFLNSDGEKEWRDRDGEFIDRELGRDALIEEWEDGWRCLFATISGMEASDLVQTVKIRGEELSIYDAVHRQLDHYGYHVGQIVLIARVLVGDGDWETLSIRQGESQDFNVRNWQR